MSRSHSSLLRSGTISTKAYNATLAATRNGVPTKIAPFESKSKDEGRVQGNKGSNVAARKHIDKHQEKGSPIASGPTSGGSVHKGGSVTKNHINASEYERPMFPKGAGYSEKPGTRQTRMKGTVVQSGPMYGGPKSRKYG